MRRPDIITTVVALLLVGDDNVSAFSLNTILKPFLKRQVEKKTVDKTPIAPQVETKKQSHLVLSEESSVDEDQLVTAPINEAFSPSFDDINITESSSLSFDEGESITAAMDTLEEVQNGTLAAASAIVRTIQSLPQNDVEINQEITTDLQKMSIDDEPSAITSTNNNEEEEQSKQEPISPQGGRGFGGNIIRSILMKSSIYRKEKSKEVKAEDVEESQSKTTEELQVVNTVDDDVVQQPEVAETGDLQLQNPVAEAERGNSETVPNEDIDEHNAGKELSNSSVALSAELNSPVDFATDEHNKGKELSNSSVALSPGFNSSVGFATDEDRRSLAKKRLEFEYRSLARDQNMAKTVSRIQKRLKTVPVFQHKSISSFLTELAPPEVDFRNSNTTYLVKQCAERAVLSSIELTKAIAHFSRAVYQTVLHDMEVRKVFHLLGGRINDTVLECRDFLGTSKEDAVSTTLSSKIVSFSKRSKTAALSIGACLPYLFMALWASLISLVSAPELVSGVDRLRESIREASASVLFGCTTLVRLTAMVGRSTINKARVLKSKSRQSEEGQLEGNSN